LDDPVAGQKGGEKKLIFDHGGVSVTWGFESMGWIRNFSAERL